MLRLLQTLHLEHSRYLRDGHARIILGEMAQRDHLTSTSDGRLYEHPQNLYLNTDVDDFIARHAVELLSAFIEAEQSVFIYGDELAYVGVFTFWLSQLFPEITSDQFPTFYAMFHNNREMSEGTEIPNYDNSQLSQFYQRFWNPQPQLQQQLTQKRKLLPIEYLLVGQLAGQTAYQAELYVGIRDYLVDALHCWVENHVKRLRFLHYSPQKAHIEAHGPLHGENLLDDIDVVINDDEALERFAQRFEADAIRLLRTMTQDVDVNINLQETLTPFRLLRLKEPTELITRYLDCLVSMDRIALLIPPSRMWVFSTNLVFWALDKNHTPPKLAV